MLRASRVALGLDQMDSWGLALDEALCAVLAHHDRPADLGNPTEHARRWMPQDGFDPVSALRELMRAARDAYPSRFASGWPDLPRAPTFWQAVAGLRRRSDRGGD